MEDKSRNTDKDKDIDNSIMLQLKQLSQWNSISSSSASESIDTQDTAKLMKPSQEAAWRDELRMAKLELEQVLLELDEMEKLCEQDKTKKYQHHTSPSQEVSLNTNSGHAAATLENSERTESGHLPPPPPPPSPLGHTAEMLSEQLLKTKNEFAHIKLERDCLEAEVRSLERKIAMASARPKPGQVRRVSAAFHTNSTIPTIVPSSDEHYERAFRCDCAMVIKDRFYKSGSLYLLHDRLVFEPDDKQEDVNYFKARGTSHVGLPTESSYSAENIVLDLTSQVDQLQATIEDLAGGRFGVDSGDDDLSQVSSLMACLRVRRQAAPDLEFVGFRTGIEQIHAHVLTELRAGESEIVVPNSALMHRRLSAGQPGWQQDGQDTLTARQSGSRLASLPNEISRNSGTAANAFEMQAVGPLPPASPAMPALSAQTSTAIPARGLSVETQTDGRKPLAQMDDFSQLHVRSSLLTSPAPSNAPFGFGASLVEKIRASIVEKPKPNPFYVETHREGGTSPILTTTQPENTMFSSSESLFAPQPAPTNLKASTMGLLGSILNRGGRKAETVNVDNVTRSPGFTDPASHDSLPNSPRHPSSLAIPPNDGPSRRDGRSSDPSSIPASLSPSQNGTSRYTARISHPSHVLKAQHFADLRMAAPLRFHESDFRLLYSTHDHGISLQTFYASARKTYPTIIAIRDSNDQVFGCYASVEWKIDPKYYGTGESFVFRAKESDPDSFEFFKWSRNNSYFQFSGADYLAMGGGGHFAFHLNGDFYNGVSGFCETFNSPCLASKEEFYCMTLEVWAFETRRARGAPE